MFPPPIYGMALKGQGEGAKFGAAFLVMAIVDGALMPTLQGLILDMGGTGFTDTLILGVPEVNFSFILPAFYFVVVGYYGVRGIKTSIQNETKTILLRL